MKSVIFLCVILLSIGCSTKVNTNRISSSKSESAIMKSLLAHYQKWKGTRYKLGGMSKSGVDCSAYVYLAFKQRFNLRLPRSTKNQIRAGKSIDRNQLKAGDLVFFKTAPRVRHVGIYLDNGRFMHASSSRGVMISRLDNSYWKKCYWFSKHIPELYGY